MVSTHLKKYESNWEASHFEGMKIPKMFELPPSSFPLCLPYCVQCLDPSRIPHGPSYNLRNSAWPSPGPPKDAWSSPPQFPLGEQSRGFQKGKNMWFWCDFRMFFFLNCCYLLLNISGFWWYSCTSCTFSEWVIAPSFKKLKIKKSQKQIITHLRSIFIVKL